MLGAAVRQASIALITCVALTGLLVLVGRGPWQRWVAPSLVITVAVGVVAAWRFHRAKAASA